MSTTFEKFAPKLKSGHVFESDSMLIFELDDGSKQVTLPIETKSILPLMDGAHTVENMIETLHENLGRVPFKALISAIQKLKSSGCLVNGEADASEFATRPEIFDKSEVFLEKAFFSIPLVKRWNAGLPSMAAFYVFAGTCFALTVTFLVLFLTMHSQHFILGSEFLKFNGSYLLGLGFFLASTSILISAKSLFKALMAMIAIGRVSNLRLEMNVYSFALRMHDEALYLTGNRWRGALSAAVVGLSQFFFFAIAQTLTPHWRHISDLFMVSVILAMIDLNPYRKSELTSFFNGVFNRKSVSHLLPYLKSRSLLAISRRGEKVADETIYAAYSTLAIAWTMFAFNLSLALLNSNFSNLLVTIEGPNLIEAAAAAIILGGIVLVTAFLVFDLVRTLLQNLIQPLMTSILKTRSAARTVSSEIGDAAAHEQLLADLQKLPLFQGLHLDALRSLLSSSTRRKVKKGASIIVQGSDSNELFILIQGEALVRKRHPTGATVEVAKLKPVTLFGENTLLENQKRSADVVGLTDVEVVCVPREALDQLKADPAFAQDHESLVNRLRLGQYIAASELFKDAPSEVISLFLNEGRVERIEAKKDVITQGQTDKDFYLLVRGTVDVIIDGQDVSALRQGDFFGEMALLLNQPRTATIRTCEDCVVLKLTAERFWFVVSHHLSLALFLETVSEIRATHVRTSTGVNFDIKGVKNA